MANTKASGGHCAECGKPLGTGLRYPFNGKNYCFDCYQKLQQQLLSHESKKQEVFDYIKKLFSVTEIPLEITSEISRMIDSGKKKSSGIRYTLYYFYEIKQNQTPIASVPYVIKDNYEAARQYAEQEKKLQEKNEKVDLNVPPVQIKLNPKDLEKENRPKFKYNIEDL